MLPRNRRLTSPAEFREVARRGLRRGGPLLVVHVLLRDATLATTGSRAGLVVSRGVGPAVTRTRVKRRLRHLLRDRIDQLPGGALLVVRAQPPAAEATSAELGAELDRCLDALARRTVGAAS